MNPEMNDDPCLNLEQDIQAQPERSGIFQMPTESPRLEEPPHPRRCATERREMLDQKFATWGDGD